MPNDPYSNFIPMQAYMAANPNARAQENYAAAQSEGANSGGTKTPNAYDQSGKTPYERMQAGHPEETAGMRALDDSLFGAPAREAEPTPQQKGNGEPGTPGEDPNHKNPGDRGYRPPPGKKQNPSGNDDRPMLPGVQAPAFSNSSVFNPMIAQLQQAMQPPQQPDEENQGGY